MDDWQTRLRADPLPWLLDPSNSAVRHLALRDLLDLPADDPEVVRARNAATRSDPIASILAAQDPSGWWVKPGPGYATKYRGTVWQLIFLDQLGADPAEPGVRAACEYVLAHTQAATGGFAASGVDSEAPPPPSRVIHCLNGNLLRALIGFGWLDDERVGRAIAWETATATGDGNPHFNSITPAAGFCCGANAGLPCAWGATKALLALARIPPDRRSAETSRAIARAVDLLLDHDPAVADYPMGYGNTRPNTSWFRLGFPSGYVADVLQVVEAVCAAGFGHDPRLANAADFVLARQDDHGRWANDYNYRGKLVVNIDRPGRPSPWVTLRACRVLRAVS